MVLSKDVVILPEYSAPGGPVTWVLANVFARTSIAVDGAAIQFLGNHKASPDATFRVWQIERPFNDEGFLADPTFYLRDRSKWGAPETLSADDLLARLEKHFILIADEADYRSRFRRKQSVLDGKAFGNLHDITGSYLMLKKRVQPSTWWIGQKFQPGYAGVRQDNLYGVVQERYLAKYFKERLKPGTKALDVGCGIGFFTNMMAKSGGEAWGIDPSEEYVSHAKTRALPNTHFELAQIGYKGGMDKLADKSFDFVFMSDALLFYFISVSEKDRNQPSLELLMSEIRRVLKDDGVFCSMEPHPVFYQTPWLGAEDRPFTVRTEYRTHQFGIVPTFRELAHAFAAHGFTISWMDELYAEGLQGECETRAYRYASEFPVWALFELQKARGR